MLLSRLVDVSSEIASTRSRNAKTALLAGLLGELEPAEAPAAISYLAGRPLQSPLGVGYAAVYAVETDAASEATLAISDVDAVLAEISVTAGAGSKAKKHEMMTELFARATTEEQAFLKGLMLRNLRQGALDGVMAEAVAVALDVPGQLVRRAAMLEGDLVAVATRALVEGPGSLEGASLELFTPLQPMLAKTATSPTAALEELGSGAIEQKLDGLRLQVHKRSGEVRVYTRNLRDVTSEMEEVVNAVSSYGAQSLILDGEGLLTDADGRPMSFQDSMSDRTGRQRERFDGYYFDLLHRDGVDTIDLPLSERRRQLAEVVPEDRLVGSIETTEAEEAERFFDASVAAGFEGVVVKDLTQPYAAGRRGSGWLKVKPVHTLDLLILGVEWGSGRRQGWLSNLHLGARDSNGDFVMLGKTFKGLTDEMLAWQTERFLTIEDHRRGNVVFVRPEIVYEIAFDGVQRSSRYPGGVALRFARVKGYREDKGPQDVDTLETVRSFM